MRLGYTHESLARMQDRSEFRPDVTVFPYCAGQEAVYEALAPGYPGTHIKIVSEPERAATVYGGFMAWVKNAEQLADSIIKNDAGEIIGSKLDDPEQVARYAAEVAQVRTNSRAVMRANVAEHGGGVIVARLISAERYEDYLSLRKHANNVLLRHDMYPEPYDPLNEDIQRFLLGDAIIDRVLLRTKGDLHLALDILGVSKFDHDQAVAWLALRSDRIAARRAQLK